MSEKARNLVWAIESWKSRRERKKSGTLTMMKKEKEEMEKEKEEMEKKTEEERRGREEEKKRAEEEERKKEGNEEEKKEIEEEVKRKKEEEEGWIKNGGTRMYLLKSLDGIGVEFGDESVMRKENNSIIHNNEKIPVSGFVGGKLDNSIHRMFE